jgi:hypothetical protein
MSLKTNPRRAPSSVRPGLGFGKAQPNNHVRNAIIYDINRAEAALRDGRYNNAIWHLERAIALDPDNQVLRDRLSSARRASGAARDRRYH